MAFTNTGNGCKYLFSLLNYRFLSSDFILDLHAALSLFSLSTRKVLIHFLHPFKARYFTERNCCKSPQTAHDGARMAKSWGTDVSGLGKLFASWTRQVNVFLCVLGSKLVFFYQ